MSPDQILKDSSIELVVLSITILIAMIPQIQKVRKGKNLKKPEKIAFGLLCFLFIASAIGIYFKNFQIAKDREGLVNDLRGLSNDIATLKTTNNNLQDSVKGAREDIRTLIQSVKKAGGIIDTTNFSVTFEKRWVLTSKEKEDIYQKVKACGYIEITAQQSPESHFFASQVREFLLSKKMLVGEIFSSMMLTGEYTSGYRISGKCEITVFNKPIK